MIKFDTKKNRAFITCTNKKDFAVDKRRGVKRDTLLPRGRVADLAYMSFQKKLQWLLAELIALVEVVDSTMRILQLLYYLASFNFPFPPFFHPLSSSLQKL
jgi:hypothetical protein